MAKTRMMFFLKVVPFVLLATTACNRDELESDNSSSPCQALLNNDSSTDTFQSPDESGIELGETALTLADVHVPFKVCIVSYQDQNMRYYSDTTTNNHRRYARRHGYAYQLYHGLVARGRFMNPVHPDERYRLGLYWQSIAALEHTLARTLPDGRQPLCERVMWIDADAIFTAPEMRVEEVLDLYGVGDNVQFDGHIKNIVLSAENNYHGVNSGVLVLRNNSRGKDFIAEIVASFPHFIDNEWPEQEAMSEAVLTPKVNESMTKRRAPRYDDVALLDQGCINAMAANPWGPSDEPGNDSLWRERSFIAHFLGPKNRGDYFWRVEIMCKMAQQY